MQLQLDREEAGQVTGVFLPVWNVGFSVLQSFAFSNAYLLTCRNLALPHIC